MAIGDTLVCGALGTFVQSSAPVPIHFRIARLSGRHLSAKLTWRPTGRGRPLPLKERRSTADMRSIAVRRGLERPLHDAPLPLVADKWPALDDPKASTVGFEAIGGSTLKAVGHATHGEALVARKRSLIRAASGRPATASQRQVLDVVTSHSRPKGASRVCPIN